MDYNKALNILLNVALYSAAWFVAWTSIMAVNARWRREKREYDKDKAEHERIIVKRNEAEARNKELEKEEIERLSRIEKLKAEELRIIKTIGDASSFIASDNIDDSPEETTSEVEVVANNTSVKINYDTMTTVELRLLAKDRDIKNFSRMSKNELIDKLRNT